MPCLVCARWKLSKYSTAAWCQSEAAYASACFLCMERGSFGVHNSGHLELLPSAGVGQTGDVGDSRAGHVDVLCIGYMASREDNQSRPYRLGLAKGCCWN